jgi:hypothetical protein
MTQLVDENERADQDDEVEKIHARRNGRSGHWAESSTPRD